MYFSRRRLFPQEVVKTSAARSGGSYARLAPTAQQSCHPACFFGASGTETKAAKENSVWHQEQQEFISSLLDLMVSFKLCLTRLLQNLSVSQLSVSQSAASQPASPARSPHVELFLKQVYISWIIEVLFKRCEERKLKIF